MVFSVLVLIWIVFNGRLTLEIFCFGVFLSAVIILFLRQTLGYSFDFDKKVCRLLGSMFKYGAVLLKEIVKANLQVAAMIVSGREVHPRLVHFTVSLQSSAAQVTLADSITLTPGTITVNTKDGEYYVHALDESFAEGLDESCFVQQLKEMEGKLNG